MKERIFLVLLSVVLIIAGGEFVASNYVENRMIRNAVKDLRNGKEIFKDCFELSDTLGFEPAWNKCGNPDIMKIVNTDEEKILGTSTSKKLKILLIGDSNTARGKFDKLLEEKLADSYSDRIEFEISKIGIDSYNTYQEVEFLRKYFWRLNPDLVVIQFTPNDFEFTPVIIQVNDNIYLFSSSNEKNLITQKGLFKFSSLYRIYVTNKLLIKNKNLIYEDVHSMFWDKKKEAMNKTLVNLNSILNQNDSTGVFVIYPLFAEIQWMEPRDTILSLLEKNGIDYVDLLDETKKLGGPSRFQRRENDGKDTIHPTPEFDNIVADGLEDYISGYIEKNKLTD